MTRFVAACFTSLALMTAVSACFDGSETLCHACTPGGDSCGEEQVCHVPEGNAVGYCVLDDDLEAIDAAADATEAGDTDETGTAGISDEDACPSLHLEN